MNIKKKLEPIKKSISCIQGRIKARVCMKGNVLWGRRGGQLGEGGFKSHQINANNERESMS